MINLLRQHELNKALENFKRVIQDYPGSEHVATAMLETGKVYFSQSRYDEALREFRMVLNKNKDLVAAEAQYRVGMTLAEKGDFDNAKVELLKVKYLYPAYEEWVVQGMFQAGMINEKQNQYSEARLLYKNIIEKQTVREYQQKAQQRLQIIAGK